MIITVRQLTAHDPTELRCILALTKHGSDFNRALQSGVGPAWRGLIATVRIEGELVGWCRTEEWIEGDDGAGGNILWETLEAFVSEEYRGRGIAAVAARALYADHFHDTDATVAVFSPAMMLVARAAGLYPTMFKREERWVRA